MGMFAFIKAPRGCGGRRVRFGVHPSLEPLEGGRADLELRRILELPCETLWPQERFGTDELPCLLYGGGEQPHPSCAGRRPLRHAWQAVTHAEALNGTWNWGLGSKTTGDLVGAPGRMPRTECHNPGFLLWSDTVVRLLGASGLICKGRGKDGEHPLAPFIEITATATKLCGDLSSREPTQ